MQPLHGGQRLRERKQKQKLSDIFMLLINNLIQNTQPEGPAIDAKPISSDFCFKRLVFSSYFQLLDYSSK